MIELEFLVFVSCIFLFIAGLIIINLNKRKENDRNNKQDYIRVNQKGKDTECCSKVSKDEAQNKCKHKSPKKKNVKSKVKKNARQDKKKV